MWSTLLPIVGLSLYVSGLALCLAVLLGVPLGAWIGLYARRGKRWWELVIYTGMGFPTVVVGLLVYLLLSRSGPLGGGVGSLPLAPLLWRR